jgi:hypothetical protein
MSELARIVVTGGRDYEDEAFLKAVLDTALEKHGRLFGSVMAKRRVRSETGACYRHRLRITSTPSLEDAGRTTA